MLPGVLVMAIAPILFYGFVFMCIKKSNTNYMEGTKPGEWVCIALILTGVVILSYMIIKQNNFIYFWDYGREWKSALSLKNRVIQNPIDALKWIYWTINNEDYNSLMPLLITFPMYLFGDSFKTWVLLIEVFYMSPAIVIIALLVRKNLEILNIKSLSCPFIVFGVSFMPILQWVLLSGFMDILEIILVSCTLLLSIDIDYSNIDIKRNILISGALILLVFFRRYFAYYVVGYLCSQFLVAILQFEKSEKPWEIIKGYFVNTFIIGSISLTVLLVFFRDFVYRSVFNNFSVAYKAWDGTLQEKFARIPIVFGGVIISLVTVGCMYYIFKNKKAFIVITSLWANIIVTTMLLWRIIQMDYHQYYLVIVPVILLSFICFGGLLPQKKSMAHGIFITASVYIVINFLCMFWPVFHTIPCKFLFTQTYYESKERNDIEEIHRLVAELKSISDDDPSVMFYTLASSGVLTSDIIKSSELPDSLNALPAMADTHNVDLRDGFPNAFLNADYLVVADPVQTHLPVDTQKIITYLAEQVLDSDSLIGSHYEIVEEYLLDNNVKAKLYRRVASFGRDVYEQLFNYFTSAYPDYPELFADRLVYPEPFFPTTKGENIELIWNDGLLSSQFDSAPISDGEGFLIYGPYKRIEAGTYSIDYKVSDTGRHGIGEKIGYVDIFADGKVLAQTDIIAGQSVTSIVNCDIPMDEDAIEFRIFADVPGLRFESITVKRE